MYRNVLTRSTCTGWRISKTGVFPVRSGGGTGSRHITATSAVRLSLDTTLRISARNADVHILRRTRILWTHGSRQRCGRSLHWDGRDKTEDLDYFYPTDVLVTGYDLFFLLGYTYGILRLCAYRKITVPHGASSTVWCANSPGTQDEQISRKRHRSAGNHRQVRRRRAQSLRLVTGNAPGNDMRFYNERVEASRNFANKTRDLVYPDEHER